MNEELNLKQAFAKHIKFISRNKLLIFSSSILAVILVILFQNFKPSYYETKAICISGISEYERVEYEEELLQRTAIDLINHLQLNIENGDYREVSELLGIDINIAYKIRKLESEQLFQQDMNEDFYILNKFEVLLLVYDNNIIEDVQKGLVYYFNNNVYISQYYKRFIESNKQIINDINTEMILLANLRKEATKHNLDVSSLNIEVLKQHNKSEISNQVVALSKLREKVRTHQELLKPLVFVKDFSKVDQREDDILIWSILGAFIGLILGMFIAQVKEVIQN